MKYNKLVLAPLLIAVTSALAQSKPTTSGYAPVNGLKIYYETYGQGAPVVLLHGAFMNIGANWAELLPLLSKTHQVIALELQGHGRTADIDRPFSLPALASDVAGVLQHLHIKQATVIGYSFGAAVAYQFTVAYPQLVEKLVIISGVYKQKGWLPQVHEAIKGITPELFANTPMKQAYDSLAPNPAQWPAFISKMIKFSAQDFDLGDDNIKRIAAPVLLIAGDNDGLAPQYTARTYQLLGGGVVGDMAGLPKSQLAVIPASTHVSLMSKTAELAGVILPFLNNK